MEKVKAYAAQEAGGILEKVAILTPKEKKAAKLAKKAKRKQ